jgi:hypothetical protein
MMKIYLMLAFVGWLWTAVVGLLLLSWWVDQRRRRRRAPAGFEVIEPNEKQH